MKTSQILAVIFGAVALFEAGYLFRDSTTSESNAIPSTVEGNDQDSESIPQKEATDSEVDESTAPNVDSLKYDFNSGYENFPVEIYRGPIANLRLRDRERDFRTRLNDQYKLPINFGGSLVLDTIGCGTGCRFWTAIDKSTGRVVGFPIGGEDYMYIQLLFHVDSALVWAVWNDVERSNCVALPYHLGSEGFQSLAEARALDCSIAEEARGF